MCLQKPVLSRATGVSAATALSLSLSLFFEQFAKVGACLVLDSLANLL